jgi:hypothetical protein
MINIGSPPWNRGISKSINGNDNAPIIEERDTYFVKNNKIIKITALKMATS